MTHPGANSAADNFSSLITLKACKEQTLCFTESCRGIKAGGCTFPHTAHKVQGKPYFCNYCPSADTCMCMLNLKTLRLILQAFMSVNISCTKNYGYVQVAIFIPTEDTIISFKILVLKHLMREIGTTLPTERKFNSTTFYM